MPAEAVYDLIIRRAGIIDGSGGPAFPADLGVKDGKILAVGDLSRARTKRVLDVPGRVAAPGFIDIHSHSDFSILVNPRAESKVRQGVTTEVIGNCGSSAAPLSGEKLERVRRQNEELEIDWRSLAEYRRRVEDRGTAVNLLPLTGQGNIRAAVMGYRAGKPSPSERRRMRALLEEELESGSGGLSTGLVYPPGVYSDFSELLELARAVELRGGIYATHMRSESARVREAVAEALRLAEESGVSLQISHLKAGGRDNWGKLSECLEEIESARAAGLNVSCDRYPYLASATGLDILLPEWAWEGGDEEELKRIAAPDTRRRIKNEMSRPEWDAVVISRVSLPAHRDWEGKTVREAARGREEAEFVLKLLQAEKLRVEALFFSLSAANLEKIYTRPYCMVGSDSSARADYGPLKEGKPHPRAFGTFPRFWHDFSGPGRLSREEAVRRMTGLPAEKLGLKDRGVIKAGAAADLVVFDPDRLQDRATYQDPRRYPDGIDYVIVNGEIVVDSGRHTGRLPGMVLK